MELFAANLDEARSAYAALSLRAQSAEATVATLQATVTSLNAIVPSMAAQNLQISRYAVAQLQANAQLATEQAQQVSPDVTLDAFVRALGLAAAVSEATMPDRTISELSATLQTYLTLGSSPDGSTSVGLRLYQPELGAPTATATLSFALAKVSPAAGSSAPPNLYSVMSAKQAVFSNSFFAAYPSAAQVVTEATNALAAVSSWTFPYLIQESSAIAGFETTLAAALVQSMGNGIAQTYEAAVKVLSAQTAALSAASDHAAGDVYALAGALDATTRLAQAVVP